VENPRGAQISFALRHKLEIMQVIHFLYAEISGHVVLMLIAVAQLVDFLSQIVCIYPMYEVCPESKS